MIDYKKFYENERKLVKVEQARTALAASYLVMANACVDHSSKCLESKRRDLEAGFTVDACVCAVGVLRGAMERFSGY